MIANVYKPRRRNKSGKSVPARLYRGRYRLDGDFLVSDVALGTCDKQVAEKKLREIVRERERSGVSQRLAQELMRHSDPKLTAMVYTDASQLPASGAIQSLDWVAQDEEGKRAQIDSQDSDFHGPEASLNGNYASDLSNTESFEGKPVGRPATLSDADSRMVLRGGGSNSQSRFVAVWRKIFRNTAESRCMNSHRLSLLLGERPVFRRILKDANQGRL